MPPRIIAAFVAAACFAATLAAAAPIPAVAPTVIVSAGVGASPDTLLLMGPSSSSAPYKGDFGAGWLGWTSSDATAGGLDEVGDFAQLWEGLEDVDACHTDYSRLVAFIDAGGGPACDTWCYGPGGAIVNTTGGLAGPDGHLENFALSPVMAWPDAAADGAVLAFDVYRHEDLTPDAPGMFFTWSVRSADTDGSAGGGVQVLADQPWRDRGFAYYGAPTWLRVEQDVLDLLAPGRDEVQVRLGVHELGWLWGWTGNDGTPAPYFDNVAVKVVSRVGPLLSARAVDLAQDNFPESNDLGSSDLHVRFDMARNISPLGPLRNDPGDSLVVRVTPSGAGAVIVGLPELRYELDANPVFDSVRSLPPSGSVSGYRCDPADPSLWAFDLPDSSGLFPGDVLHFHFWAEESVGGVARSATLPADLDGFGDFDHPWAYDPTFVVRALPTLDATGHTPGLLIWDDGHESEDGWDLWATSLDSLHLVPGVDYDLFRTRDPGCGVGNGLGGRTVGPALAGYADLWYAAGPYEAFTLADGSGTGGAGDDVAALRHWLDTGGKDLLLCGDNLAGSLAAFGGARAAFVANVMGVDVVTRDVRPAIANQATPRVLAVAGNPVFTALAGWIAYGGCADLNTFDGVTPRTGAAALAEFADPSGAPGGYGFAAATLNTYGAGNRVVSLPYDLRYMFTDPYLVGDPPAPARTRFLADLAAYFEVARAWEPPVPSDRQIFGMGIDNYVANGAFTIVLESLIPIEVDVRIFDLRGRRVRDFGKIGVDTQASFVWDCRDDDGRRLASGMYIINATTRDWRLSGKMIILR